MWTVPGICGLSACIILPMARSMLVVVFILAFAWQWTDTFYTNTLMGGTKLLPNVVLSLANSNISASHDYYYNLVQANTALLLAVLPLLILYVLVSAADYRWH